MRYVLLGYDYFPDSRWIEDDEIYVRMLLVGTADEVVEAIKSELLELLPSEDYIGEIINTYTDRIELCEFFDGGTRIKYWIIPENKKRVQLQSGRPD